MEKFSRKKKFNFINSIFYHLDRFLPFNVNTKLNIYLNLEFIFNRLASEKSYLRFKDKHPVTQNTISLLKKYIKKNNNILDIGCGNGYLAHSLSGHAKKITCIDYDSKAIGYAKSNFTEKNIKFILGDILKIEKSKIKKIDIIICSHIIEHLEQPFNFLKNLKRFNSKIYIEVPDFENNYLNQVKKKTKNSLTYVDDDHIYEFDRLSLIKNLKKIKFQILKENYQNGMISLLIK